MSYRLYRLFLNLLPKFRVDPDRKGRCVGELIRRNVSRSFPQGGNTALPDIERWEVKYSALEAIANNVDQRAFPRTHSGTASGMTVESATAYITEFNKTIKTESGGEEITSDLKTEKAPEVGPK